MFNKMLFIYLLISTAVIMDYRYYKIPNSLTIWGLISAIFFNILIQGQYDLYSIVIGLVIPFVLLYPVFIIGGIGAGDIKLLCVIGAVIGIKSSMRFTMYCFIIAGIIGVLKLVFLGMHNKKKNRYSLHKIHFCYAIFIASVMEPITNIIFNISEGELF